LTFPCYLTTFSGKKCLSGKVICVFFCPAYRNSSVCWKVQLCRRFKEGSFISEPSSSAVIKRELARTVDLLSAVDLRRSHPNWETTFSIDLWRIYLYWGALACHGFEENPGILGCPVLRI
jgi:hypothetical protein